MKSSLHQLGEDALISRLVALMPRDADPSAGPGDDCAVIDLGKGRPLQLLKTDAMVERVHFLATAPPRKIGWKAIARVVSDFAAMGGTPDRFLITLALPSEWPVRFVESIYRGMADCMKAFGGTLAGGETTRVPAGSAAMISIAATGLVARNHLVLRSGGMPGDLILVTGKLGGSITGKHLSFTPRQAESQWLVTHARPSAMMDLSDGLAKDLPRLAKASDCGFQLDSDSIPRTRGCNLDQALGDGEDFELLLTLSPKQWPQLSATWKAAFPKLSLTVIGQLTEATGKQAALTGGWDPFTS